MSSIRSILKGINDFPAYTEKDRENQIDQALKDISELIDEATPKIKKHICRFNDGDCVCECYKAGQDEFKSNLKELFK